MKNTLHLQIGSACSVNGTNGTVVALFAGKIGILFEDGSVAFVSHKNVSLLDK